MARLASLLEALKFLANYGPGAYLLRYLLLTNCQFYCTCEEETLPGGSQLIKDAISKPGDPEIQEEVWEKMLPLIHNLTDLKQSYSALNEVPFGKKKVQ